MLNLTTMSKRIKIYFLSTLFALLTSVAYAKEITVGFGHHKHPYVMLDEYIQGDEGHEGHNGIEYSIIRQAFQLMGEELIAKSIAPKNLKRAIKKFRRVDAVSGVKKSNDKFFYSDPILEIENIAISKASQEIKLDSISNLAPFQISSRRGSYTTLGRGFNRLYHPKSGSHKTRHTQYDRDLDQHIDFWKPGSETIMITNRLSFEHYKNLLSESYHTSEEVTLSPIFPSSSRYYIAFRSRELRNEFNEALATLKFEGTYKRIFRHYSYDSPISKYHKPNFNKVEELTLTTK